MCSAVRELGPVRAYRELRRDFAPLVLVLAAGDLVASLGFSLIFPFLTLYLTQHLGASAVQAGLVLAGYSLCSIASGATGGWLADRIGRRAVMVPSVSITAAVVVLMGQAGDLVQIAALVVVLGLVDPAFVPAARAAIADVVEEERRPRAYSLLAVASAVGWIAGPSIGAGLATLGYPLLFTIAGLLIGCYGLIALRWLPETLPRRAAGTRAVASSAEPAATSRLATHRERQGGPDAEPVLPPPGAPLAAAAELVVADASIRSRELRSADEAGRTPARGARAAVDPRLVFAAFLPIAVVVHAATFQWVAILPIHASRSLGVPTAEWGLLFSINGILIVLLQLRVTSVAERFAKPLVMAAATLCYAAGSLVTVLVTRPADAAWGLGLTIVLVTFGEILLFPIEPAFVSDLSPIERRGRYQGLLLAADGLGSAVGPPLGGLCLDLAPGATLWLITAGSLVLSAAALAGLSRLSGRMAPPAEAALAGLPAG